VPQQVFVLKRMNGTEPRTRIPALCPAPTARCHISGAAQASQQRGLCSFWTGTLALLGKVLGEDELLFQRPARSFHLHLFPVIRPPMLIHVRLYIQPVKMPGVP
jgi:hypothetical protein